MLTTLRPKSYNDYLDLPIFGMYLDEFTDWSYARGYTLGSVRNQLKDVRHISKFMFEMGIKSTDNLTRNSFNDAYKFFKYRKHAIAGTVKQLELFLSERIKLPEQEIQPKSIIETEVDKFMLYLESVRGLAVSTVNSHAAYIARFLEYINFEPF